MRRCGDLAENCVYKIGRIVTRVDFDTIDPHRVRVSFSGLAASGVAHAAIRLNGQGTAARAAG